MSAKQQRKPSLRNDTVTNTAVDTRTISLNNYRRINDLFIEPLRKHPNSAKHSTQFHYICQFHFQRWYDFQISRSKQYFSVVICGVWTPTTIYSLRVEGHIDYRTIA